MQNNSSNIEKSGSIKRIVHKEEKKEEYFLISKDFGSFGKQDNLQFSISGDITGRTLSPNHEVLALSKKTFGIPLFALVLQTEDNQEVRDKRHHS